MAVKRYRQLPSTQMKTPGLDKPEKVPVLVTRKARKGSERDLKAGYRADAA